MSLERPVTRSIRRQPRLAYGDPLGETAAEAEARSRGLEPVDPRAFLFPQKAEALVGSPTEVGGERGCEATSLGFLPKEEVKCLSRALGRRSGLSSLRDLRSSSGLLVGAEASTVGPLGGPKACLPPLSWRHRSASETWSCAGASAVARPGARHATRKLMAPPLRFLFLSASLSLGSRCVSACLTDTVRSQGFSPSQRFHPARAWRLCFASLPPIGFWPSELFPLSQP